MTTQETNEATTVFDGKKLRAVRAVMIVLVTFVVILCGWMYVADRDGHFAEHDVRHSSTEPGKDQR